MREIKFRAWVRYSGNFEGSTWQMLNNKEVADEFTIEDFSRGKGKLVAFMQYTGIKDKNGTEIYEWDILLNKSIITQPDGILTTKIIGDIQILNGMTYLVGKTWQDVDGEDIRVREYKSLMLNPELFKIIGNIYENPEIRDNN